MDPTHVDSMALFVLFVNVQEIAGQEEKVSQDGASMRARRAFADCSDQSDSSGRAQASPPN